MYFLKHLCFRNRLGYLPNGVSTLDINVNEIDCISKENIVITVGRLGEYVKNNELLLDAIKLLSDDIVKKMEVYVYWSIDGSIYTSCKEF